MHEAIKHYYGKTLSNSADLKTDACCDRVALPDWLKPLLERIHPDVQARYFGCGLACPQLLSGCRVLDLGCGAGRDVYVLSQLVGQAGEVVGVDMTDEQLGFATQHQSFHDLAFGFSNTHFIKGYIERLDRLDLPAASFDVIVSNCVLNLATVKSAVLAGVRRLLKPGGEFYFSDVYADRRLPANLKKNPELVGECLGAALYWNDFLSLAKRHGFPDPRLVEDRPLNVNSSELSERMGDARFFSATYRLFKIDALKEDCEDFGQEVSYRGTISGAPERFILDKHHDMVAGQRFPVCGNTWLTLNQSRFRDHFDFFGSFECHFGLFEECGRKIPFNSDSICGGNSGTRC